MSQKRDPESTSIGCLPLATVLLTDSMMFSCLAGNSSNKHSHWLTVKTIPWYCKCNLSLISQSLGWNKFFFFSLYIVTKQTCWINPIVTVKHLLTAISKRLIHKKITLACLVCLCFKVVDVHSFSCMYNINICCIKQSDFESPQKSELHVFYE